MPKDIKRKVAVAPKPSGETFSKHFLAGLDNLRDNPRYQPTAPAKMSFKIGEGVYGC
jgi:hypothetical protein